MRPFFIVILFLLCLLSCTGSKNETSTLKPVDSFTHAQKVSVADSNDIEKLEEHKLHLVAGFTGSLGKRDLEMNINYIGNRAVIGIARVAGERRNFHGSYELDGDVFRFHLKETGEAADLGYYDIASSMEDDGLQGKWTAYSDVNRTEKVAVVRKTRETEFSKDTNAWITDMIFYPYLGWQFRNQGLSFSEVGKVKFVYYEDFYDSTSQMITLRGSWGRQRNKVIANFPDARFFGRKQVIFKMEVDKRPGEEFVARRIFLSYDTLKFYPRPQYN